MVVAVVRLHPLPFSHHCQEAQSDEPASLRQTEAGAIRTERVNYRCSTLRHVFQIISFTRWRDLLDRHFSALPPSPPPGYSLESLSLSPACIQIGECSLCSLCSTETSRLLLPPGHRRPSDIYDWPAAHQRFSENSIDLCPEAPDQKADVTSSLLSTGPQA